ncbi:MAG TPA: maleylpyruvate isomerase N-terminal domain-containing protein [Flavisolibacter sp.]
MEVHPVNTRPPVDARELFAPLDEKLLSLLRSLTEEEWNQQTIAPLWKVRDAAAHLLDGSIRALSMQRDGYFGISPSDFSHQGIINWLNQTNAEWVTAARRISPQLMIFLHEQTGAQVSRFFALLQPFDKAIFDVTWAGEEGRWNWMHVAREYTEKWLHQQQIRDAVQKPGIITKEFFYPFIATLVYALPKAYENVDAPEGTRVHLHISSEAGGDWAIIKSNEGWKLATETGNAQARISIDPDTAWKLFSKGMRPEQASSRVTITGDESIALPALSMVAVMA